MDEDVNILTLTTLRQICQILEEEGNTLRDDVQGLLRAMENSERDCLVRISRHSIVLFPDNPLIEDLPS